MCSPAWPYHDSCKLNIEIININFERSFQKPIDPHVSRNVQMQCKILAYAPIDFFFTIGDTKLEANVYCF